MPKFSLKKEMEKLFEADEDVKEMILLGKLPPDIAEISAEALEKNDSESRGFAVGRSKPFMHIAQLIQQKFWPNAPELKRGGFMRMLSGGPAPAWVIIFQVAAQITDKAREYGYDIPESEGEKEEKRMRHSK